MTKPPAVNKTVIKTVERYLTDKDIFNLIKACYMKHLVNKRVGNDEKGWYIRWEEEI